MLEIRPNCEYCDRDLPFDSSEAMICTFEYSFCPNCDGSFELRPIRPKDLLQKYPPFSKDTSRS